MSIQTRRKFISYALSLPLVGLFSTKAKAATLHNVTIKGFAFSPATLKIKAGDTVRWTNKDGAPHTADDAGRKWKTGTVKRNKSADVTFDAAGKFNYVCKFHPDMKGKITVTA
jgi:plastocyanin